MGTNRGWSEVKTLGHRPGPITMVSLDTGGLNGLILCAIGSLMALVESAVSELSTEECFAVGLNRANLLCSSCDTLKEFSLQTLESNCRKCCQEDDVNSSPTKYPRAQLEVCG